jgi:hypothetical protein
MRHYVWTVPLLITAVSFCLYYIIPVRPPLMGDGGLLSKVASGLTLLPGFFITALAAVATFNRPDMDETMSEPPPKTLIAHQGGMVEVAMTRRMFLSYLFSYLSILSFCLFLFTTALPYIISNIYYICETLIPDPYNFYIKFIIVNSISLLTIYFFSSLLVTMLHGIYFLCERMHMPNT